MQTFTWARDEARRPDGYVRGERVNARHQALQRKIKREEIFSERKSAEERSRIERRTEKEPHKNLATPLCQRLLWQRTSGLSSEYPRVFTQNMMDQKRKREEILSERKSAEERSRIERTTEKEPRKNLATPLCQRLLWQRTNERPFE